MRTIIIALLMMLCVSANAKILETKTDPVTGPYRVGDFVGLNMDLGFGKTSLYGNTGMLALHAGWMHISEPSMLYIGPSIQLFNVTSPNYGLQLEAKNLWMGVWGQLGLYTNKHKRFVTAASAGFSFLGAEFQTFEANDKAQWSLFGKLQIDIGLIAVGFIDG